MPLLPGLLALAAGIWLMRGWESSLPVVKVLAVLLVVAGSLVVLLVIAMAVIGILLARFARGLKRDAKSVAYSIRYMVNMGRMGGTRPPTDPSIVDVEACPPNANLQDPTPETPAIDKLLPQNDDADQKAPEP